MLTPGQNRKRPVFGTVNLRTGAWHYRLTDRKRSVEFMAALTDLLTTYPEGRIYLLVDNGSIHASKTVQQWLNTQDRLQLVYLPSYAGHKYNPTEKVWWHLKDAISANSWSAKGIQVLMMVCWNCKNGTNRRLRSPRKSRGNSSSWRFRLDPETVGN